MTSNLALDSEVLQRVPLGMRVSKTFLGNRNKGGQVECETAKAVVGLFQAYIQKSNCKALDQKLGRRNMSMGQGKKMFLRHRNIWLSSNSAKSASIAQ